MMVENAFDVRCSYSCRIFGCSCCNPKSIPNIIILIHVLVTMTPNPDTIPGLQCSYFIMVSRVLLLMLLGFGS